LYFDEWFEQKMMAEYQKMMIEYRDDNMPDAQRQLYVRKTEARIIEVIRSYSSSGIAHLQLSNIIGIDRKNLTPYMKRLMSRGLVKRGEGKQGKYYPITKERRGTHMTADIFSKAAAAMILKNEDFPVDSPFFRNIVTDSPSDAMFVFSNKVGAIFTYLLIQAMNKSNRFTRDPKNDKEKDLNVDWWIDDAISSLRRFLLPILRIL
jgi:predicted transcriptional regulator